MAKIDIVEIDLPGFLHSVLTATLSDRNIIIPILEKSTLKYKCLWNIFRTTQSVGEGAMFQSLCSLNHKAESPLHENFDDSKVSLSLLATFFLRTEYDPQCDLALPSPP